MAKTLFDFCHARDCMELLTQWDCRANLPLTPQTIFHGSRKSVWWQCEKGHHWRASVNSRTSGKTNCPYCSGRIAWPGETDLASRFPALAKEWHPTKNLPLTPDHVLPGSERKVWWRCSLGHEWQAEIRSRTHGCGCPVCANRVAVAGINDLASQFPELDQEWHPTKNGKLTPQNVTPGTRKKVWWRCKKGHEWCVSVQARTLDGTGCPVCAGRKILAGENDMASRFPEIASEWHPTKNGNLQPTQISPVSKRRVWWICPRGHEYLSAVGMRTMRKSGCPYCAGKKVLAGFNDLATTYPQIAAQWHPNLNGALTPQMVTAGSHKKAWWICTEGHVWKAFIYSRTGKHQRGCPVCAGVVNEKRRARYESMASETDRSGSGENRVNLTKEDTR